MIPFNSHLCEWMLINMSNKHPTPLPLSPIPLLPHHPHHDPAPPPSTALRVEEIVRRHGAIPATIALLNGKVRVGLSAEQLNTLGDTSYTGVVKVSRRDLGYAIANVSGGWGSTSSGGVRVVLVVGGGSTSSGGVGSNSTGGGGRVLVAVGGGEY